MHKLESQRPRENMGRIGRDGDINRYVNMNICTSRYLAVPKLYSAFHFPKPKIIVHAENWRRLEFSTYQNNLTKDHAKPPMKCGQIYRILHNMIPYRH